MLMFSVYMEILRFTGTIKSVTTILILVGALLIVSQFVFISLSISFIARYLQQPFLVVPENPTTYSYTSNISKEEIVFKEQVKEIENLDPKETLILEVNKKTDSTETLNPLPTKNTSNDNPNLDSGETVTETTLDNVDKKLDLSKGGCDIYKGKWVYDERGPLYTNNSCPIITRKQNCQGNGRPDKEYENWRWKPNDGCDLPRFQPKKFLELMRGKTLAFVGDSLARNQFESLLCILWQVEVPKKRGKGKTQRWYFKSTSTLIVRIWSAWLVHKSGTSENGVRKVFMDVPDETFMDSVPGFDVLVLSSGHWYANKKNAYVLNGTKNAGRMKFDNIDAFGISTETALTALIQNPNFTGLTILRTYSPDHYKGGEWNTGGSCTGKTKPVKKLVQNSFTDTMYSKQIQGFQKAMEKARNGSKLKLMDVTSIFGSRPDGHPGPYKNPNPDKNTKRESDGRLSPQDCSHWCMPGPADIWNEMLLEIIRREFEGRLGVYL